jgi:hypothetical protein
MSDTDYALFVILLLIPLIIIILVIYAAMRATKRGAEYATKHPELITAAAGAAAKLVPLFV